MRLHAYLSSANILYALYSICGSHNALTSSEFSPVIMCVKTIDFIGADHNHEYTSNSTKFRPLVKS